MSSQASSAGHGEQDVRRKIVETGDVDVMIGIRPNFFYTRTVPCELWFFDRGKPANRKDKVLMLDARNIYRKVTRKINDFSNEQLQNLAAVVWLYRGQSARFLDLVMRYFTQLCAEIVAIPSLLAAFDTTLLEQQKHFDGLAAAVESHPDLETAKKQALVRGMSELNEATLYKADAKKLLVGLRAFSRDYTNNSPNTNKDQHTARKAFDPLAEAIRGIVKQVDLVYKVAATLMELGTELAADEAISVGYERRTSARVLKRLDQDRKFVVAQLRQAAYLHRQIVWLQDRFPKAELQAVPGLVKVVERADIAKADWSLTPGRYVGVAPAEVDEDFDFEQTIRDIHVELTDLNREANDLAKTIEDHFESLGL